MRQFLIPIIPTTLFACGLLAQVPAPVKPLTPENEPALLPPPINLSPGDEYADSARMFQGIPSIESSKGRLWAAWYGGGKGEDHLNYVMLSTSADKGQTWSAKKMVIDPDGPGPVRAFDPCLWNDPKGHLWLTWAQRNSYYRCYTWAIMTENPGDENPKWSAPVKIADGILMNKPLFTKDGAWLLPVANWMREGSSGVVASTDSGNTWQVRGSATIPDPKHRNCDEHMLVERADGSLLMWVRTKYGIGHTISTDHGKTWPDIAKAPIEHDQARFFIHRLQSGKLLLVKHGALDKRVGRKQLMAFLSSDDAQTWQGGLMLDERRDISYPDGAQDADGTIHIIYDRERKGEKQILTATFTEQDVAAGKIVSPTARLKVLVNQATGVLPPASISPPPPAADIQKTEFFKRGDDGYFCYRIPAIVISKKKTLLAFCEGRKTSPADHGDIDLVLRRSFDSGKTWEPLQIVHEEGGAEPVTIGNPVPVVDHTTGDIWLAFCRDNDRVFITKSSDDGVTWAAPTDITAQAKKPEWSWYATGPGHGIQLASGRLVIPCDSKVKGTKIKLSLVIYSDDHGKTWNLGGSVGDEMNECQVAELDDGSLLLSMRNYYGKSQRAFATSRDAGLTWSPGTLNEQVFCCTCEASILRYPKATPDGKSVLIYSGPNVVKRKDMTIRLSRDGGQTWPVARLLQEGSAEYSDLVLLPDGRIGCLYERNGYRSMHFDTFTLDWLTANHQP